MLVKICREKKYKDGEILVITGGSYEEYEISAVFRVNTDFDAEKLNKLVPLNVDFESWLNLNGYIVELSFKELHVMSNDKYRMITGYKK